MFRRGRNTGSRWSCSKTSANGKFKDISKEAGPAIQTPRVSRGMAVGDLYNDGRLEAVVENLVGRPASCARKAALLTTGSAFNWRGSSATGWR